MTQPIRTRQTLPKRERAGRRSGWALALGVLICVESGAADTRADVAQLQTLMQRNNCTACHLIDKRKYGPTFQEIAQRYAGDAGSVAVLAAKIKAGGSGVWGEDLMPPQPGVSDAQARSMAELILGLKP